MRWGTLRQSCRHNPILRLKPVDRCFSHKRFEPVLIPQRSRHSFSISRDRCYARKWRRVLLAAPEEFKALAPISPSPPFGRFLTGALSQQANFEEASR